MKHLILLLVLLHPSAWASESVEEILVRDYREPVEERSGLSSTVLSRKEIEDSPSRDLLPVLAQKSSISYNRTGGYGSQSTLYLRGIKSEQVLVVVDGIALNDPSTPGRSFDLEQVSLDHVEKIEILKGSQPIYGSEALGGVILITTRRDMKKPVSSVTLEGGSQSTFKQIGRIEGATQDSDFSFSISHSSTEGISAANETKGNSEKDGYDNLSLWGQNRTFVGKNVELGTFMRFHSGKSDLDRYDPVSNSQADDPNYRSSTTAIAVRQEARIGFLEGRWQWIPAISFSQTDRKFDDDADQVFKDDLLHSHYTGRIYKAEVSNSIQLGKHSLQSGVEFQKETARSTYQSESIFEKLDQSFNPDPQFTLGLYARDSFRLNEAAELIASARADYHPEFGDVETFQVGSRYFFGPDTEAEVSLGTGFRAPTLYQLDDPKNGNKDLSPEKSLSLDVSLRQKINPISSGVSLSYFQTRMSQLIDYNFTTSRYYNHSRALFHGVEVSSETALTKTIDFSNQYTFLVAKDLETGNDLPRRPQHQFRSAAELAFFNRRAKFLLAWRYVGTRPEASFSSPGKKLSAYDLLETGISYQPTSTLLLSLKAENLLDRKYEEIEGYGTLGRSFYVSGRMEL